MGRLPWSLGLRGHRRAEMDAPPGLHFGETQQKLLTQPCSFKEQDSGVFMATGPHHAMQESRKENGG